jgi:abhydrolase domain-containing protein 12
VPVRALEGVFYKRYTDLHQNITASVLIAHAENDWDITHSHSDVLFHAFLEPHLPPLSLPANPFSVTPGEWEVISGQQIKRAAKRTDIVESRKLKNFGRVDSFSEDSRKVVLVKTLVGGHDYLGVQEGLVDIIGKTFGLL